MDSNTLINIVSGVFVLSLVVFLMITAFYMLLSTVSTLFKIRMRSKYKKRMRKILEEGNFLLEKVEAFDKHGIPTVVRIANKKESKIVEVF
jgi:exosome complex RNA-binding protein Rrp4